MEFTYQILTPYQTEEVSTICAQWAIMSYWSWAGREINTVNLQYESVNSMISSSENIWFHSDKDTEDVNPYEEMIVNKFERHNIHLNKPEMHIWSIFSNIVKYIQYDHLQTDIDIKAPVDRYTMKIFAKLDNDEYIIKDIN